MCGQSSAPEVYLKPAPRGTRLDGQHVRAEQSQTAAAPVVPLAGWALLKRHLEGDERAFAELVREFRRPVYGYLVRCGVDAGIRDDLFQEIFVKVHRHAEQHRPDASLTGWLFAIVANTVRSHFRKRHLELVDVSVVHDAVDPAPPSDAVAAAAQTADWLEEQIRSLPLPQKEVLILATNDCMSMKEIGEALGLTENTVKTHLRRARMQLAKSLARRNAAAAREIGS